MSDEKSLSFKDFVICVLFATILQWGFFACTTVPTSSMENTIKPNTYLLISKIHYGPRIPMTPLQIPLTHQTTNILGIKSYLNWIQLPYYRLPGLTKIKRNDIVVFNTPKERTTMKDQYPVDLKTFYVKRCLGLPGEKIKMINNNIFINGEKIENDKKSLCRIEIQIHNQKNQLIDFLKKHNITNYIQTKNNSIIVNIDEGTKEILEKEFKNLKYTAKSGNYDTIEFIDKLQEYKDVANWGEFLIPQKGMEIEINHDNLKKYGDIIQNYDSNEKIKIKNGELFINNKKITKYIFNKNYYFMIGDNRMNSTDSRFFGPVPEDHIYAKAIFILSRYFNVFTKIFLFFFIIYIIILFLREKN